jgi:hypothetical protein
MSNAEQKTDRKAARSAASAARWAKRDAAIQRRNEQAAERGARYEATNAERKANIEAGRTDRQHRIESHLARVDSMQDRLLFAGIRGLKVNDDTISYKGTTGPIRGCRATVETAGAIESRIGVTRALVFLPLALAWRK